MGRGCPSTVHLVTDEGGRGGRMEVGSRPFVYSVFVDCAGMYIFAGATVGGGTRVNWYALYCVLAPLFGTVLQCCHIVFRRRWSVKAALLL